MTSNSDISLEPNPDGRRARRERGRLSVINAMIDLVSEGHTPPTAEQAAERAGVSTASVFRYFETLDDLRTATTHHYFDRFSHVFGIPEVGVGSLDHRIDTLVRARVAQHETTCLMARLIRSRVFVVPELAATLRLLRKTQSDQVRLHFGKELVALTPAAIDDTVLTVATLTSFESWEQLSHDHGRSSTQIRRAWTTTLGRCLEFG